MGKTSRPDGKFYALQDGNMTDRAEDFRCTVLDKRWVCCYNIVKPINNNEVCYGKETFLYSRCIFPRIRYVCAESDFRKIPQYV